MPLPRVLVVDNSLASLAGLTALLGNDYDVVTARNGAEAVALLANLVPDVVVVEWRMPDLGGLAVCASVKANARTRHVPVVVLSGDATPEGRAASLDAGADDFLVKPFAPVELFARLRKQLLNKRRFDELEAAARERELLSQMIVHDLRSPLTGVTLTLDLLRDIVPQAESSGFIDRANNNLARANSMLSDLLLTAKIRAGRFTVARTPIDVADALDAIATDAALQAQARGLTVRVEYDDSRCEAPWWGDRTVLRRVVDNLLGNAFKHAHRGQTVVLRATRLAGPDDVLEVAVVDQGVGVAPQHRPHLFERFCTFAETEQPTQPIGLGLAFCKLATEAHGGSMAYAPNEPNGSVFTARFAG